MEIRVEYPYYRITEDTIIDRSKITSIRVSSSEIVIRLGGDSVVRYVSSDYEKEYLLHDLMYKPK